VTLRWLLALLHLLALGIGLGAVWARSNALRTVAARTDPAALRRALGADAWWGAAAFVWLSTGLWRLFGATEKATAYYMESPLFWTKMALFALIFALEVWPIVTLTRWRRRLATGATPDTGAAGAIARIGVLQAILVVAMVAAATGMARGYGAGR
jgi:putative membrane protein